MKSIVIYSSRTGNTKKVAEAIASTLPKGTPCVAVKDVPADVNAYDLVFMGFWVDRGSANAEAKALMNKLTNAHIAVFATLGAYANSEHAGKALENGIKELPADANVVGKFICQGAVDPKVIEMMYKMFPAGSVHGKSPERDALHAEAAKHPDAEDLANARAFVRDVLVRLGE